MSVSYRMSWSGGFDFDNNTILEVITTETYRCIGPVNFGQDRSGRGLWHLDVNGSGYNPDSKEPTCETVKEMLEKGWVERVDDD